MTRFAVFAYGSLVDPRSASLTLGRPAGPPAPCRLAGWRRRWSISRDNRRSEKTFAVVSDGRVPDRIVGLNIEPDPEGGAGPVGALVEVDAADLDRLDLREVRYDRVDVTGCIEGAAGFDRVIAYTAKPAQHTPDPPAGAVIIAAYVRLVEAAFEAIGLRDEFWQTTDPPPVPVVEARLVADRIPPGNPRDW
jgi:hypothetical protein